MALTRARPVFGSAAGAGGAARRSSTTSLRTRARSARSSSPTRRGCAREIARHKPPRGPFDIKLGAGRPGRPRIRGPDAAARHRHRASTRISRWRSAALDRGRPGAAPRSIRRYRLLTRHAGHAAAGLAELGRARRSRRAARWSRGRAAPADWDELLAAHDAARQSVGELWRAVAGRLRRLRSMLNEGDRGAGRDADRHGRQAGQPGRFRGQKLVLYFYPKDDTSRLHPRGAGFHRARRRVREGRDLDPRRLEGQPDRATPSSPTNTASRSSSRPTRTARSARRSAPGSRRACTAANIWGSTAPPS